MVPTSRDTRLLLPIFQVYVEHIRPLLAELESMDFVVRAISAETIGLQISRAIQQFNKASQYAFSISLREGTILDCHSDYQDIEILTSDPESFEKLYAWTELSLEHFAVGTKMRSS
jgi:hypothetical protein